MPVEGDHPTAISVVLPAYNSARTLTHAISSILNQSWGDWELIIMDDGSSDNTIAIAESFRDSRIRIIGDGEHRGLAAQLNRAVRMARGRYIARMDADDIAYPERLERQISFLRHHPEVDLLGGFMVVFRRNGKVLGARRPPLSHKEICARPWATIPMAHPTWMGKIEWFRRNLYREDAVLMEDRELLLRTFRHSTFANLPQMLIGYREDSLSLKKILLARKGTCRMMIRSVSDGGHFLQALLGIFKEVAQSFLDTAALVTGLNYILLRNRALPLLPDEEREWNKVWHGISTMGTLRPLQDHVASSEISKPI